MTLRSCLKSFGELAHEEVRQYQITSKKAVPAPSPIASPTSTFDIRAGRRDIHAHPELGYDIRRAFGLCRRALRKIGCDEIVTGLGETGIVGGTGARGSRCSGNIKVISSAR